MPISKKSDGWYWGSKGPFKSKDKAEEDLESVFGQPGQRVTGGTKWNRRVK